MTAWFTKKKKTDRLKEILGDYELPRFRKTIFETLQRLREHGLRWGGAVRGAAAQGAPDVPPAAGGAGGAAEGGGGERG